MAKHDYVEDRTQKIAEYIVDTKATIRQAATTYGISKSAVHHDMRVRLPAISSTLATEVSDIFAEHLSVRHIRGGEATRQRWLQ